MKYKFKKNKFYSFVKKRGIWLPAPTFNSKTFKLSDSSDITLYTSVYSFLYGKEPEDWKKSVGISEFNPNFPRFRQPHRNSIMIAFRQIDGMLQYGVYTHNYYGSAIKPKDSEIITVDRGVNVYLTFSFYKEKEKIVGVFQDQKSYVTNGVSGQKVEIVRDHSFCSTYYNINPWAGGTYPFTRDAYLEGDILLGTSKKIPYFLKAQ